MQGWAGALHFMPSHLTNKSDKNNIRLYTSFNSLPSAFDLVKRVALDQLNEVNLETQL
jgi:hypothetical protein